MTYVWSLPCLLLRIWGHFAGLHVCYLSMLCILCHVVIQFLKTSVQNIFYCKKLYNRMFGLYNFPHSCASTCVLLCITYHIFIFCGILSTPKWMCSDFTREKINLKALWRKCPTCFSNLDRDLPSWDQDMTRGYRLNTCKVLLTYSLYKVWRVRRSTFKVSKDVARVYGI